MQFYKSFWSLLKPYWSSEEKFIAFGLLFLNILCIALEVRTNVAINAFSNDFYAALQNFDKPGLIKALEYFAFLLIILIITAGYGIYFNGLLCIRWRRWLTTFYVNKWLNNSLKQIVDNPDQRISEDLDKFSTETLSAFFIFLQSTLTLFSFGLILWNLSGNFLKIPGYLFWCAMIYAVIGTTLINKIGKKLPIFNYHQQQYNADFRYLLIKMRDKNEISPEKLQQTFQPIYSNFINITQLTKCLTFFNKGYNTIAFIIGLTIAIPLYMQKQITLGTMMQISGAFSSVIIAFSIFVDKFSFFSEWRSVIWRLAEFVDDNKTIINYTRDDPSPTEAI